MKSKKTFAIALAIAIASTLLTSCNLRSCYCCVMEDNVIHQVDTYTDMSQRCESLNTNTRKCMEEGSHLPCSAIAFDMKKHQ